MNTCCHWAYHELGVHAPECKDFPEPTTQGKPASSGIFLPGARIPTLLAALFVLTVAVVFVGAVVAGGVG